MRPHAWEGARPVAIIGAQTYRRALLEMRGHVETFVIVFRPGGFFRLFSVAGDAFTRSPTSILKGPLCSVDLSINSGRDWANRRRLRNASALLIAVYCRGRTLGVLRVV